MLDRIITILVAGTLAVLIWLYARSREQEILENVAVPVEVTLSPGLKDQYTLDVDEPSQVIVTFTGMPAKMRELRGMVQRGELLVKVSMSVPESNAPHKPHPDIVRITPADLHAPAGVKCTLLEGHDSVRVSVHRIVEKRIPVRFDYSLESYTGAVVAEPATVVVRGPQEVLERTTALPTQPWVLSMRSDGETQRPTRVPLVQELEGKPIQVFPTSVLIRLPATQRKVYVLHDIPVQFLCPSGFNYRPRFANEKAGKLTLRVQGPVQEEPPRVQVFIDLSAGDYSPCLYTERPCVQLPKDFTLAQEPPRDIAFELMTPDSP